LNGAHGAPDLSEFAGFRQFQEWNEYCWEMAMYDDVV